MKYTLLITILLIAVGLWWQNSDQKIQEEIHTSVPKETESATKPSKTIAKKSTSPQKQIVPSKKILRLQSPPQNSKTGKYAHLGDDFAPFDEDGNRFITQVIRDGKHLLYHGDVLIGDTKDLAAIQKRGYIKTPPPRHWPNGQVPYIIDENLMNYENVMNAIEYVNQSTNAQLIPHENQKEYVHFTLGESDCYSYVGMIGGMQEIFLNPACKEKEIIHEIMHTLGFFHEQNREDRDEYIEILWDNIDPVNHTQFKKIPNDFLGVTQRPFDFQSIMMYSSFTFTAIPNEPSLITKEGQLIPQSQLLLSDEDIERVNLAYPLQ